MAKVLQCHLTFQQQWLRPVKKFECKSKFMMMGSCWPKLSSHQCYCKWLAVTAHKLDRMLHTYFKSMKDSSSKTNMERAVTYHNRQDNAMKPLWCLNKGEVVRHSHVDLPSHWLHSGQTGEWIISQTLVNFKLINPLPPTFLQHGKGLLFHVDCRSSLYSKRLAVHIPGSGIQPGSDTGDTTVQMALHYIQCVQIKSAA